jgi:hypothetical protein
MEVPWTPTPSRPLPKLWQPTNSCVSTEACIDASVESFAQYEHDEQFWMRQDSANDFQRALNAADVGYFRHAQTRPCPSWDVDGGESCGSSDHPHECVVFVRKFIR